MSAFFRQYFSLGPATTATMARAAVAERRVVSAQLDTDAVQRGFAQPQQRAERLAGEVVSSLAQARTPQQAQEVLGKLYASDPLAYSLVSQRPEVQRLLPQRDAVREATIQGNQTVARQNRLARTVIDRLRKKAAPALATRRAESMRKLDKLVAAANAKIDQVDPHLDTQPVPRPGLFEDTVVSPVASRTRSAAVRIADEPDSIAQAIAAMEQGEPAREVGEEADIGRIVKAIDRAGRGRGVFMGSGADLRRRLGTLLASIRAGNTSRRARDEAWSIADALLRHGRISRKQHRAIAAQL